jgi:hypothetical protein
VQLLHVLDADAGCDVPADLVELVQRVARGLQGVDREQLIPPGSSKAWQLHKYRPDNIPGENGGRRHVLLGMANVALEYRTWTCWRSSFRS